MTNHNHGVPLQMRALLVDESEIDRQIVRRVFRQAWPLGCGFVLDSAAGCIEALDLLARKSYVLVLMEWNLPGFENGGWLKFLRARKTILPVLIVSGIPLSEIRENLDELGAAYLNKDELTSNLAREAIVRSLGALARARYDFTWPAKSE